MDPVLTSAPHMTGPTRLEDWGICEGRGGGLAWPGLGTLESGQGHLCSAPQRRIPKPGRQWFWADYPHSDLTASVSSLRCSDTGFDATFLASLALFTIELPFGLFNPSGHLPGSALVTTNLSIQVITDIGTSGLFQCFSFEKQNV